MSKRTQPAGKVKAPASFRSRNGSRLPATATPQGAPEEKPAEKPAPTTTTTTTTRGDDDVRAAWVGGYSESDLKAGVAVLSVLRGDDSDRSEELYWGRGLVVGGRFVGMLLTKFDSNSQHYVRWAGAVFCDCSCGDQQYRHPGRGCKHIRALNGLVRRP
jgi:hypothetical protein